MIPTGSLANLDATSLALFQSRNRETYDSN